MTVTVEQEYHDRLQAAIDEFHGVLGPATDTYEAALADVDSELLLRRQRIRLDPAAAIAETENVDDDRVQEHQDRLTAARDAYHAAVEPARETYGAKVAEAVAWRDEQEGPEWRAPVLPERPF